MARVRSPEDIKNDKVMAPIMAQEIADINQLPHELQDLCLAYASSTEEKVQYPRRITFFEKNLTQRLHEAANDLLLGYGDKALALVTESPWTLECKTHGKDRLGRCIQERNLLQIAAMAGDVNLRKKKAEEKKDHGMVERLSQAAGLTPEDVANQLFPVLFSEDAKKANEARKQRILTIIIYFAESIYEKKNDLPITWNTPDDFKAAQTQCQTEIDELINNLIEIASNEIITSGFILDSSIYADLARWFERPSNLERFGRWGSLISDLFWTNGYGALQYIAAARDAQAWHAGTVNIDDALPPRSLTNSDGSSDFVTSSKLGRDFYLTHFGSEEDRSGLRQRVLGLLNFLTAQAARNYAKDKSESYEIYALLAQSEIEKKHVPSHAV